MKKISPIVVAFSLVAFSGLAQLSAPRVVINSMGHSAKVQNLNFTPDGQKIISVSEDKTIRLWNANTGEMLKKFESEIGDGSKGMFYASDVSPDGSLLAVAGYTVTPDNQIYIAIIDLNKGIQVATALGHKDVINSLAFTGNGKYLVSGSNDGTLKVWKVDASTPMYSQELSIETGAPVKYLAMNLVNMDVAIAQEGKTEVSIYSLAILEKGGSKFNPRFWKKHLGEVNK
jgi:WD40 repeat protein